MSITASHVTYGQGGGAFDRVLSTVRYKDGWAFSVRSEAGFDNYCLVVDVPTVDPQTGAKILVSHRFSIPPYINVGTSLTVCVTASRHTMSEPEIENWIFQRILDIERHEAGEFYKVNNARPFLPDHGPDSDPYNVRRVT